MLLPVKLLTDLLQSLSLGLNPHEEDEDPKENIPRGIHHVRPPADTLKHVGEDHGDEEATKLVGDGEARRAGGTDAEGQDFRDVHGCERGDTERVRGKEEEDGGDGAHDAAAVIRRSIASSEATDHVEEDCAEAQADQGKHPSSEALRKCRTSESNAELHGRQTKIDVELRLLVVNAGLGQHVAKVVSVLMLASLFTLQNHGETHVMTLDPVIMQRGATDMARKTLFLFAAVRNASRNPVPRPFCFSKANVSTISRHCS